VYVVGTLFVVLLIAALVVVAFRRRMANVIDADDENASLVIV
jgi:hypothetical protein